MSHVEQPPEGGIKIVDRRHFTSEGERRPNVPDEAPVAAKPASPPAAAPTTPAPADAAQPAPAATKTETAPPKSAPRLAQRQISFLQLVEELAMTGAMQLGAVPDPRSQRPQLDIEGARETIDLLGILQEKTHGNLTPEEASYMDDSLYQLRMAYMELMQRAATAATRPPQPPKR